MILITGGTGFIGKALTRHLTELGYPVRVLLRPSANSPDLPVGLDLDVVVSSLADERGLRAAMVGVKTVFHLASSEREGGRTSLMDIDIQGARAVFQAAADAGVDRVFFISHLGADRASAYPLLKAKAISEEHLRKSGVDFTILRSAAVFGVHDWLTSGIAGLLDSVPSIFLIPGDGTILLQPLWVEDLVTCLTWSLQEGETRNRTIEIGGPEYLSFHHIVELIMQITGTKRRIVNIFPPYLRGMTVFIESILPSFPSTVFWLDYLAVNRTTSLDTVTRTFGLIPSRLSQRLDYLKPQGILAMQTSSRQ